MTFCNRLRYFATDPHLCNKAKFRLQGALSFYEEGAVALPLQRAVGRGIPQALPEVASSVCGCFLGWAVDAPKSLAGSAQVVEQLLV